MKKREIKQTRESGMYKIGALLPLTGKDARYGQWIKEALELGKEEINQKGGIKGRELAVVYEDDVASPKKAVLGMKKLCQKFKVPVVFGSWASSCVSTQIPIAKKTKTMVLAEAIAPRIESTGGYVLRIQPEAEYYLKRLVPFVYFDLKIKRVCILNVKNDFGITQGRTFKQFFENFGGKIIYSEGFSQGEKNFKTKLIRIKKEKPEAVFVPAYTEIIPLLKQAKKLKLKVRFLASVPFENPDILSQTKEAAERVIYPYHYSPDPNNIVDLRFRKRYKQKYKREPEGFAALAYDGIYIIAKALKNWGQKDRESLKNEFYKIHHFGVTGEIVFDETGNPIKKIVIKTVKNGKFIKIKEKREKLYLRKTGEPFPKPYPSYHSLE
jgi:branched-chain amino acid transport system substrate-binding protein